jgi:transposase
MAMRRSGAVQDDLMATWAEMPRSPGHAFYDRLQELLREAGFDVFVEQVCKPYYAPRMGAPSLPPGRYFRMHMIGYFEGIDSERGIVWRCADSFSLRDFLRLSNRDKVPDHSWLSRTRSRLPHEAHEKVFGFVLRLVAGRGLVKGERIGVDGSTMEANAALRTIVRRDSAESYREMLTRMAKESGIDTPSAEDLARFDRKRKGKTLSNADWKSPTDPEAKIARMKDGTTHLAYKPEHAVDLDTGVAVAAPIHPADQGDTTTLSPTLEAAAGNLAEVGLAPSQDAPCVVVADKGYHARDQLKALDSGVWKTRIAEPEPAKGYLRWRGDEAARRAVYANRARLKSEIGRETMRRRGELVERSFAHILDRGGMRRAWLRGRENIHKRYLIHVAGFNLGILMRALIGQGTPREAADANKAIILVLQTADTLTFSLIAVIGGHPAALVIAIASTPHRKRDFVTGLLSSIRANAAPASHPILAWPLGSAQKAKDSPLLVLGSWGASRAMQASRRPSS